MEYTLVTEDTHDLDRIAQLILDTPELCEGLTLAVRSDPCP